MLTEALKNDTKLAHAELEGRMIPAIKAIDSEAGYYRLLEMMYGFYAPLEESIDAYVNEEKMPGYGQRRKASLLIQDMTVLNQQQVQAPQQLCTDLPVIENYAQAIGAMYVLEGSTLGGKIIAGMIQKRVAAVDKALHFFNGYGEKAMNMWNAFKEQVNTGIQNDKKVEVIQSANDTFTAFKRWIALYEQQ